MLREEPVCRYCKVRASTVVDHVMPLSKYPHLAHERSNLAGACRPCNGRKHDRVPGQPMPPRQQVRACTFLSSSLLCSRECDPRPRPDGTLPLPPGCHRVTARRM